MTNDNDIVFDEEAYTFRILNKHNKIIHATKFPNIYIYYIRVSKQAVSKYMYIYPYIKES